MRLPNTFLAFVLVFLGSLWQGQGFLKFGIKTPTHDKAQ